MTRGDIGDLEHDQDQGPAKETWWPGKALSLPQPHLILIARAIARDPT